MKETKSKDTLVKNTVFIYLMRIANYVFPMITLPYLTRVLGVENYGIYSWINAVITYFRLITDFGFIISSVGEVAEAQGDKKKIGIITYSVIVSKIVICSFAALILFILSRTVNKFSENSLFLLFSFLPVIVSVFNVDFVFQGIEKMKYITYRTLTTKLIFTVMIFLIVKNPNDYIYIPLLTCVGDVVVTLLMHYNMIIKEKIKIIICPLKEVWIHCNHSFWFFASRCASAVWNSGNTIVLGFYFNDSIVAHYTLAFSLISVLQNFITPIADSLYPYMVRKKDYKIVKKVLFIFEPIIILGIIIALFVSKPIISFIFGSQYSTMSNVFCILLPTIIVLLPSVIFGFPTLVSLGLFKQSNLVVIAAAGFHILGTFLLIQFQIFNIYTISVLTCLTETILMILRISCYLKGIKTN